MFYVPARDEEDDISEEADVDNMVMVSGEIRCKRSDPNSPKSDIKKKNEEKKKKSCTLTSTTSSMGGSYDTPPESPPIRQSHPPPAASSTSSDTEEGGDDVDKEVLALKPPVPPPRQKRKQQKLASAKLELLKISEPQVKLAGDMLMAGYPPMYVHGAASQSKEQKETSVKGHLSMLVISAKGLRHIKKVRFFVIDPKFGKLRYYRHEDETELLGEIDVQTSTFLYDIQNDKNGEFTICSRTGQHVMCAGTSERRMYWLQQLQKARREGHHNLANRHSIHMPQVGLLKEKTPIDEDPASTPGALASAFSVSAKDSSPFKEIMQTMERPPTADFNSPPRSADYYKKPSFFQSFTRNKHNFRLPRSASMRTPSPPPGGELRSPPPSKPLASPSTSFQALSKIRRSFRDKRGAGASQGPGTPHWSPSKRFGTSIDPGEIMSLRDDLQAARDEAAASKEVIAILRKQVETGEKEKETLSALINSPGLDDGQLLEILRTKDGQIVELESQVIQNQKLIDLQTNEINKTKEELTTYQHLLENKDDAIVRLTNHLHEIELNNVMTNSVNSNNSESSAGGGAIQQKLGTKSNGLSFDSDKFEFKEFVDVASQTTTKNNNANKFDSNETEKEELVDTVTAYEMQNKFLNKEVLELNQLRQQAIDREQKLFIEASDWEAKFYQIQSKYLLLLNELHNPQVAVSASRQEMVGQLLKDIVEAAERPNLTAKSNNFDRFGFRICENSNPESTGQESLENKAEKLRKQAEDKSEDVLTEIENLESKWNEAISSLNAKVPFVITSDIKRLLRHGIPISQRGAVWKAIVDHKLMRATNELFQADYYQKLLSNYNPGRNNLSPAAKQIELDLLRTLPNNKHYDSLHADGVPKLRRVLLAYSIHNPEVEYCQGFNRIAAIALLFMNEEDAFWLLVYIIEHLMPPEYYSRDKQLIGAQVDQEVLKELLVEKLPRLGAHFAQHSVDAGLFSLNWFLCIFVDNIPVKTYLHIWDSFLFEGSKVLFRYAIAIFKLLEEKLLLQTDYMSLFNTLRSQVEKLEDVRKLTQIAFRELNPFPMRIINNKREHHYKVLEAQKRELELIRQKYRKNSLARSPVATSSSKGKPSSVMDNPPMVFFSSDTGGGPGGGDLGDSEEEEEED